jgi:hypothetical protein
VGRLGTDAAEPKQDDSAELGLELVVEVEVVIRRSWAANVTVAPRNTTTNASRMNGL